MLIKEVKEFFKRMPEDTNYLGMKLLSDVFFRMNSSDKASKNIITNLDGFSAHNIQIIESVDMLNSVFTSDDKVNSRMKISLSCQEMIMAHEFGHLLLDLFSDSKLPKEYMEVNHDVQNKLVYNFSRVSLELSNYCNIIYEKLISNIEEPMDFIRRNPFELSKFFQKYEDVTENDYISSIIGDYLIYMSNFDIESYGYNKISNIIDGSFHGTNPFLEFYGNSNIFPILTSREEEYFLEDLNGKYFAGFEEQFADYLVMKLYNDRLYSYIDKLKSFIGEEWFIMMDNYYEMISIKVFEKAKSYRK
ncbi:MAG: hypothetical protein HFJ11_05060 [Bacilli bacterium]|nr:hypothetical protein [Bacilli bacterium]